MTVIVKRQCHADTIPAWIYLSQTQTSINQGAPRAILGYWGVCVPPSDTGYWCVRATLRYWSMRAIRVARTMYV